MSKVVQLSEATNLAIHGLMALSQVDELVTAKQLASKLNASEHHLSKLFQRLVKAGYVESVRGPSGGFRLAKSGEAITYLEIYEVIEGKLEVKGCLLNLPSCAFKLCPFGDVMAKMTMELREFMHKHTITPRLQMKN